MNFFQIEATKLEPVFNLTALVGCNSPVVALDIFCYFSFSSVSVCT